MRKITRWVEAGALVAAVALVLLVSSSAAGATPDQQASAAETVKSESTYAPDGIGPSGLLLRVTQDNVNMRTCPSTSCAILGKAHTYQTLVSWCYVSGQTIGGTPYWDVVYNKGTRIVGYITEDLLTDTGQLNQCYAPFEGAQDRTTQDGVNMRACPSTSCGVIAKVNDEHSLTNYCWTEGSVANGNPYWDIIFNPATGRAGFVNESLLGVDNSPAIC